GRPIPRAAASVSASAAAENPLAWRSRGAVRPGRARGGRRQGCTGPSADADRAALRLGLARDRTGLAAAFRSTARRAVPDRHRKGLAAAHGAGIGARPTRALALAGCQGGRGALHVPLARQAPYLQPPVPVVQGLGRP